MHGYRDRSQNILYSCNAAGYTERNPFMVDGALDIFTLEPQTVQVTALVGHREICI
jgi:hypothetical protein